MVEAAIITIVCARKKRDFFSQWAAKILRWQPYNGNPGQQADQDGYCFNNAAAATIHKRF